MNEIDKKLSVYDIDIDDFDISEGVNAVALVCHPAIEVNFLKFAKEKKYELFYDDEQHIIFGPAIICDQLIYRYDGAEEYYVKFSADVIKKIVQKVMALSLYHNVNIEHNSDKFVNGSIVMIDSFVTSDIIANPKGYEDVAKGSWFIGYKVLDDRLWNLIKSGEVKGFSVEGFFEFIKLEPNDTNIEREDEYSVAEKNLDDYIKDLVGETLEVKGQDKNYKKN